ncbi:acetyltransferase [Magnaporthiopsis poae ATCC 64411]|uniref:Acetyltransferase n=1 Tax=Magnaporthiopsis poae (strain ATCC 64411 / 73-15) TaxID=644358 RepID=A0A0C4DXM0_MAGP6|nr:acetyltransferase [Magnaporthiopsis poae ATCC 64411]
MAEEAPTPPLSSLTIRKATTADLPLLQPLVQSAYRGEPSRKGWTTEADLIGGQRIDPAGLLDKINDPLGAVLIAFPAGEAAGPIACCEVVLAQKPGGGSSETPSPDPAATCYFGLFAVDPEQQRGGFGKTVLARAEEYARDTLGARRMEMTVIWTREELISWYLRRGYVKTGEKRPWPYGQPENGTPLRDDLYFDVLVKDLC